MKKKTLLSIGSLVAMAAPVAAVVACGSTDEDTNGNPGGQTGGDQNFVGTQGNIKAGPFSPLTFTKYANWSNQYSRSISDSEKSKISELHNMRAASDSLWADTGDVVIDTINDFRFVVQSAANNNWAPADKLKEIITNVSEFNSLYTGAQSSGIPLSSLRSFLAHDINQIIPSSAMGGAKTKSDLMNIGPVYADYERMAVSQYRSLQMEFLGQQDSHNMSGSTTTIKNANGTSAHVKGLKPWDTASQGSENLTSGYHIDSDDKTLSYYEAFMMNWDFFNDANNSMPQHMVGHRVNMLVAGRKMGWSMGMLPNDVAIAYSFLPHAASGSDLSWLKIVDPNGVDMTGWAMDHLKSEGTLIPSFKTHDEAITWFKNALKGYLITFTDLSTVASNDPYANINRGVMPTPGGNSLDNVTAPYDVLGTSLLILNQFK